MEAKESYMPFGNIKGLKKSLNLTVFFYDLFNFVIKLHFNDDFNYLDFYSDFFLLR